MDKYFELQKELAEKVIFEDELGEVKIIAGVDVAYEKNGEKVIAAITLLEAGTLTLLETAVHSEKVSFPYIPGLFSFRELPPVLKAFKKLTQKPDLIVCDGQGYAHPRRFGLACHLGVELDIPAIGCAKKRLIGEFEMPGSEKGAYSNLYDQEEIIGRVLRTQENVNPVFVSVGRKIDLPAACRWVFHLCPSYRLPETTRTADHAVKMAMKKVTES